MGVGAAVQGQRAGGGLAGTMHTAAHAGLVAALTAARREAGLSQAALATRLGKPPSFVAKYELGERRLDAVEVLVIARVLGREPAAFLVEAVPEVPDRLR